LVELVELDEFHLADSCLLAVAKFTVIDVTRTVLDFCLAMELSIDPKPFKYIAILINKLTKALFKAINRYNSFENGTIRFMD